MGDEGQSEFILFWWVSGGYFSGDVAFSESLKAVLGPLSHISWVDLGWLGWG